MSRKRINEENIRQIQKSKRSYYVILPIGYIRELGWKEQEEVRVVKNNKSLIIKKYQR